MTGNRLPDILVLVSTGVVNQTERISDFGAIAGYVDTSLLAGGTSSATDSAGSAEECKLASQI